MSLPEPDATPAPETIGAAASRSPRRRGRHRGDDLTVYSLIAVLALIAVGYGLAKWAGVL